jgi:radical SAM protein with 4Fe4S-binding SPASM domain
MDLEKILEVFCPYIEEINFFTMKPVGRAKNLSKQLISYKKRHEFSERLEKIKNNYPSVRILHNQQVTTLNSIDQMTHSEFGLVTGGPDGFTRFNILPDGSMWPGGYTPRLNQKFYLGNIKKEDYTLLRIWRDSLVLDEFRKMSLNLQEKCLACKEKNKKCPGGSMEMEFYRENNPDHKNPYCRY